MSTEVKKVAGVIVTHGHLAGELLAAAEMIIGPISHIAAVSIGWHDDVDAAREEVQRAISRVSQQKGVLLLTDSISERNLECKFVLFVTFCGIHSATRHR